MLALLSGALYGALSGRAVQVDWTDAVFAPEGDASTRHVNLFPLLFESATLGVWEPGQGSEDVEPATWRGKLAMTAANLSREIEPNRYRDFGVFHRSSVDVSRTDHAAKLLVFWAWRERILPMRRRLRRQMPELAGLSDTEILRRLAGRHLQPSEPIREAVERAWTSMPEGPAVGLHIRHSDMKAPVEPLVRRAEAALARLGATHVVLATDNAEVEQRVRARLGENRVYATDKAFATPGVPLHYDTACRDRIARASEALTDMLLLSRCDHMVYASRSSFGYLAHVLADARQTVDDCDRLNPKVQGKRLVQKYWYR
mgnify:FL=1